MESRLDIRTDALVKNILVEAARVRLSCVGQFVLQSSLDAAIRALAGQIGFRLCQLNGKPFVSELVPLRK